MHQHNYILKPHDSFRPERLIRNYQYNTLSILQVRKLMPREEVILCIVTPIVKGMKCDLLRPAHFPPD